MIKTKSNKINGWIILDKQSGITSRQALTKISKIFNKSLPLSGLLFCYLIILMRLDVSRSPHPLSERF